MDGWGFESKVGMPNFDGHSFAGAVSTSPSTRLDRNVSAWVAKFVSVGADGEGGAPDHHASCAIASGSIPFGVGRYATFRRRRKGMHRFLEMVLSGGILYPVFFLADPARRACNVTGAQCAARLTILSWTSPA